jgi:glycerol-3-phosphate O-acyltransferase / dihydroxyacetone phosphate acyltransferase
MAACNTLTGVYFRHREHFRSDVLLTFNPPINLKVKVGWLVNKLFNGLRFLQDHPQLLAPADFNAIKELTSTLQAQISLGTIDAPTWEIVQIAKTATRLYAPLGTRMSLGNYVRVLRTFVDAFTAAVQPVSSTNGTVKRTSNEEPELSTETETEGSPEIFKLMSDLKVFYPLVKIALASNINDSEISKQTQQIWP